MKNRMFILVLVLTSVFFACQKNDDNDFGDFLVATPITMSTEEFKNGVDIIAPQPMNHSGKIYAYKDFIFINDTYRGVHVINNSNPASPVKQSFIKIPGNVDISIKDDVLYADSLNDLIVIDISDIGNPIFLKRLENVLAAPFFWPWEADVVRSEDWDSSREVLLGWDLKTERLLKSEVEAQRAVDIFFANAETADASTTGEGGSLARFKIVADYLYAVDSHTINIFNIEDLNNPQEMQDVYAGFDIETIFNKDNYLFLGSMRGMYIYAIDDPAQPQLVSEFEHGTACDPVVVDDQYAYVTLRGGNMCGALESGLFIIDLADMSQPELLISYPMDEPYGLGLKGESLFICDGASGLKVYDKTDVMDLKLLQNFEAINAFDVIPLSETLLLVGKGKFQQYTYIDGSLELLSELTF